MSPTVDKGCVTHFACDCVTERLNRVHAVFKKYEHLDTCLSDLDWLKPDPDDEHPFSSKFLPEICYELWLAVKPLKGGKNENN